MQPLCFDGSLSSTGSPKWCTGFLKAKKGIRDDDDEEEEEWMQKQKSWWWGGCRREKVQNKQK